MMKYWYSYRRILWLLLWLGYSCSFSAVGSTLRVGLQTYIDEPTPHYYVDIYPRLFEELGKLTGDKFEFVYLPPSRLKKHLEEGKIDIEPGINPVWRKNFKTEVLYTVPFWQARSVVLYAKSQAFPPHNIRSLNGRTLGVVRSYAYPKLDEAFAYGWVKRYDAVDQEALLEFLVEGRMQQVVINPDLANYWLGVRKLKHLYAYGPEVGREALMMGLHPNRKAVLPRLNSAIETLQKKGTIAKLYQGLVKIEQEK